MRHSGNSVARFGARWAALAVLCVIAWVAGGCSSRNYSDLSNWVDSGEFGHARTALRSGMTTDEGDRNHMLDRLRLGIAALADGVMSAADRPLELVYERLRTQGLNDDKTLAVAMWNDKVTYWKGEPFEQALAFLFIGAEQALDGEWDGMRAAADSSLFHLKDFAAGSREELAKRAAQSDDGDYLQEGYTPVESNFALGYLLKGIADHQIQLGEQARDELGKAVALQPALQSVVHRVIAGQYDTVLLIGFGRGPRKVGAGMDGAIAAFEPAFPSDARPVRVRIDGGVAEAFPVACDLNEMARDQLWRGLDDIRVAKSVIGNTLMMAGAGVGALAVQDRNKDAALVAMAGAALGAVVKKSAHADTTYCEFLPQRFYVAPLQVGREPRTIEIEVEDHPVSRLRLVGVSGGAPDATFRYLPLVSAGVGYQPPFWAAGGDVSYCSDSYDRGAAHVPFILGGACCCTPTYDRLREAQQQGFVPGIDLAHLIDLYHQEGLFIAGIDAGEPGLHVLEGGDWLYSPLVGTVGFARLFGQVWSPYVPRSDALRQYLASHPPSAAR